MAGVRGAKRRGEHRVAPEARRVLAARNHERGRNGKSRSPERTQDGARLAIARLDVGAPDGIRILDAKGRSVRLPTIGLPFKST